MVPFNFDYETGKGIGNLDGSNDCGTPVIQRFAPLGVLRIGSDYLIPYPASYPTRCLRKLKKDNEIKLIIWRANECHGQGIYSKERCE
jgi:hypothetical protein